MSYTFPALRPREDSSRAGTLRPIAHAGAQERPRDLGVARRLAEEAAHGRLGQGGAERDQRGDHRLPHRALQFRAHLDLADLLADRFTQSLTLLFLHLVDPTAEAVDDLVDVRQRTAPAGG